MLDMNARPDEVSDYLTSVCCYLLVFHSGEPNMHSFLAAAEVRDMFHKEYPECFADSPRMLEILLRWQIAFAAARLT